MDLGKEAAPQGVREDGASWDFQSTLHFQVSFSDAVLTEPRTLKPVRARELLSHCPLLSGAQAAAVGFAGKDKLSCSPQSLASSWSSMGPGQSLSEKNFSHEVSLLDDQAITFSW